MSLLLNYDVTAVENAVNPSKFNKGKITIESLNAFKKFLDGLQPDQVVSIVGDLFDCFDTPSGDKAPYPLSEQYEDNKVTSIQDEDGKELQVLSPNKTRLTEHFYMLCDLFDLIQQYPEIYFIFHTGYYHTNWKGLKDTKNFVVMAGIKSFAKHYSKIRMVGKDENKEKLLDAKKSFIEDGTYFNLRDNVPSAYFCVTVHNISWIKATMYGFIMNHYGQFDPLVANRCVHIVFSNRLFELKSKVRMCTRVGRYNPTNPSEVLQEAIWEDFRFSDLFDC